MAVVAEALLTVALVVALGLVLRRSGAVPAPSWAPLERLTYFVLFPCLIFVELARADLGSAEAAKIALVLVAAQLSMAALAFALRRPLSLDGPRLGALVQGVVRWNSYTALALAPLLFGPAALGPAAVAVGSLTPMANLVSVWVLARHGGGSGARLAVLRGLATNPLLLACIAGLAWNFLGPPLPRFLQDALLVLGRATLALGLLAMGAALEPVRGQRALGVLVAAAIGRLVVEPLLAIGLARLAGLDGVALGVVALCSAVPTSSTAYLLARALGGDAELTAAVTTVTTLLAILTLPAVLTLVL